MQITKRFAFIAFMCGIFGFASAETNDSTLLKKTPAPQLSNLDTTKHYKIFVFPIREEIAPPVWRKTQKAFEKALEEKSDMIIIEMNTYGGRVDNADSIRSKILRSPIPVIVFIDNNAASAGALISIACDRIFMNSGSSIGAATVVDQSGQQVPDKFQSYMRSMMRATAKAKGRDPNIAEAMVDPYVKIPGIIDSGKVLTFTSDEAMQYGFCDGIAESRDEVIKLLGIKKHTVTELRLSATDKIIGFLISPVIAGLLIMVIIGGIYFELQTPGIGFPLAAAVTAALLYFAPHYLEGLAEHWEILLFIGGLVLIAIEIFAIPGFGVTGISGIALVVTGLVLSMLGNVRFDFSGVEGSQLINSFFIVIVASTASLIASFYLGKKLFTQKTIFGELALNTVQNAEAGFIGTDPALKNLLGAEGIAMTVLRPSGKVLIDNDVYDASSDIGYIEKGEKIRVVRYETAQLFVRKA